MAEPLKKSTLNGPTPEGAAPRSARARSERDLGRNKRPARGQRSSSPRAAARSESRPVSERPRNERGRQSRSGSGSPQRPRDVSAGNGARMLAPIALVVFAIACFVVLTNQSSDGKVSDSASSGSTAGKAAAAGAAASTPTRSTYKVKAGDSFAAIAEKQGVDVNTLQELNPDIDPRALQPGQKLKLK